ncbi:MAG: glucose-6-phosphate dehydrogenase [Pseudomonadales bacterium]|nr:glucose-6-phosphate dehydrogenase [Pseudomonadales bacterium]
MTMICDFLIIGGDGDLAFRKLYPALYHLDLDHCLPDCLRIICVARHPHSDTEFCAKIKHLLAEQLGKTNIDTTSWKRFSQRLSYHALDATNEAELSLLSRTVLADTSRDLITYLATPPLIFAPICQSLWAVGLARDNMRLVIEKPLGSNRDSFLAINDSLTKTFQEHQIYRIDHYLGKETVQNLLTLRFANALFEPLWSNNYIDHVQITAAESIGAGGRWPFYDEAGALRDMVQNHLLQLLCLLAMEPPSSLDARAVHDEKLKVLHSLGAISGREVAEKTVRGQYIAGTIATESVPSYLQEEDAKGSSDTETFVAIKASINNWRWAGVPFYLRTGKRLQRRFCEIVVQFKKLPHALFPDQANQDTANKLLIRLQPEEGIRLYLLNKVPGLDENFPLENVSLDLSLSDTFTNRRVPEAYERLLLDVMRANSSLFMRADQVEAAWQWVDAIAAGWKKHKQKPLPYMAGSMGPSDSIALIARDGRRWQE